MLDYKTYCKIRDMRLNEKLSYREISRQLCLSRPTISKWANADFYEAKRQYKYDSIIDQYKPAIQEELALTNASASSIFQTLKEHDYAGSYSTVRRFVSPHSNQTSNANVLLTGRWMLLLMQGKANPRLITRELHGQLSEEDVIALFSYIRNGRLRERNHALAVLAYFKGMSLRQIARFLMVSRQMVTRSVKQVAEGGIRNLFANHRSRPKKYEQVVYKDALFKILHSPPRDYGFNRTTWTMTQLYRVMKDEGFPISMGDMRMIIKRAGFKFRKAKKVLTSSDPEYRSKLIHITGILSKLLESESFFSIDELGPVSVKIHGGVSLVGPGEQRVVPQFQKSKGHVLLIGALELSTNQMTYFYADRKTTDEMIRLVHILIVQYSKQERLYLSWDAASWHGSKRFKTEVEILNSSAYRTENKTPQIILAPLPSCSQFLNVIESVFSGMARAIIHNSNYETMEECIGYIDRYILERNEHFLSHPKRAGNKIWGKEREIPIFSESNNCKDPLF